MQSFRTWMKEVKRKAKSHAAAMKQGRRKAGLAFHLSDLEPEEKKVIRVLAKTGSIEAKDLGSKTGLGLVKTRAIIQGLYNKNFIQFDDEDRISLTPGVAKKVPGSIGPETEPDVGGEEEGQE